MLKSSVLKRGIYICRCSHTFQMAEATSARTMPVVTPAPNLWNRSPKAPPMIVKRTMKIAGIVISI